MSVMYPASVPNPGTGGASYQSGSNTNAPAVYTGTLLFCFVTGEEELYRPVIYGPQAQAFTPIGALPDGRKIGVCASHPETVAIIKGAHPNEYICSTWNELLTRVDLTPYVSWVVQTTAGVYKLERDLVEGEEVVRTPSGRHKRRWPPLNITPDFDPDYIPPVGTSRIVPVDGGVDAEHVVLTGPDGVPAWYDRRTGSPVEE